MTIILQKLPQQMFTKSDVIVLLAAFVFIIFLYSLYWQGSGQAGEYLRIVVGNSAGDKMTKKISLFQNQIITVRGGLGVSEIQIEGGRVRFLKSPCTNKLCIQQGWINNSGELLACLPNQISASIFGRKNDFDTINF